MRLHQCTVYVYTAQDVVQCVINRLVLCLFFVSGALQEVSRRRSKASPRQTTSCSCAPGRTVGEVVDV